MLVIWMPEGQAAWRWRLQQEDGWHTADQWDDLLQATQNLNQKDVVLFIPTTAVHLVRVPMTRAQLRQLGQTGVRYLLEEYALGSVDQLDVRYVMSDEEHLTICAMPATVVTQYQQAMALGPWQLQAMLPDFLLLPLIDQRATLLLDPHVQLLRVDEYLGYPAEDLDVLLSRLPIDRLTVMGQNSDAQEAQLQTYSIQAHHVNLPLTLPDGLLRHPFDLLPKQTQTRISGYWKVITSVLVFGLLVQMSYDHLSAWRYSQVAKQTREQTELQFKTWFPQETRIVNLKRQVEGHLQQTQDNDTQALLLISRVGPILQQTQLVAQAMRYQNQQLELDIQADNIALLEQLQQQLTQQGLNAQLGNVRSVSGAVSGLMTVR